MCRRDGWVRLASLGAAGAVVAGASTSLADEPGGSSCPPGMRLVPGGTFPMGDAHGFPDELPVHDVKVRDFCLDVTEVTVAAYAECVARGMCTPAHARPEWSTLKSLEAKRWSAMCNRDRAERRDHPVNCVLWAQGDRYCKAQGFRLPSEAEWEYAARGGAEARPFPWGDAAPTADRANLCGSECAPAITALRSRNWSMLYAEDDGWLATAPVGSFPKGDARWGHHDMTGNVCEWVGGNYCPYSDPDCADVGARMCRGNHFLANNVKKARPARRNLDDARHRSPDVGFRCAAEALERDRPAPTHDRVAPTLDLPSPRRVALTTAVSLVVGAALAGFGGAASVLVVGALMLVAQSDPKTAIATGFVVVAAAHAAGLVSSATRRRIDRRAGAVMAPTAFAAALIAGALARFAPERIQVGALCLAMVALAASLAARVVRGATRERGGTPGTASAALRIGAATAGALGGAFGFATSATHAGLLRRLSGLPEDAIEATAALPALFTALGGALGYATHALPDAALALVMGSAAAAGALARGIAPRRKPSRAAQAALALALVGCGVFLFVREIVPARYFPRL